MKTKLSKLLSIFIIVSFFVTIIDYKAFAVDYENAETIKSEESSDNEVKTSSEENETPKSNLGMDDKNRINNKNVFSTYSIKDSENKLANSKITPIVILINFPDDRSQYYTKNTVNEIKKLLQNQIDFH